MPFSGDISTYYGELRLTERLYDPPSKGLYKKLNQMLAKEHGGKVYLILEDPSIPPQHNHYGTVLRECQDLEHESCIQELYVTCPFICDAHNNQPLTRLRLNKFLKRMLL